MNKNAFRCTLALATFACPLLVIYGQTIATPAVSQDSPKGEIRASSVKLPDPSGPFGIGRVGYEWMDASRPNAYSMDPVAPDVHNTPRALMVYLWYPSQRQAARNKGDYLPGAKQMDADPAVQPLIKEEFGNVWPLILSGDLKSHALENAPIARSPRTFPVVIFSHGTGGTGFEYTTLIEDLVSHGYVVASIEHPGMAFAVVFPDGKVVPPRKDTTPAGLSPEQRMQHMMASAGLEIAQDAEDMVFVLNKLAALNQSEEKSFPLSGRLDLTRVAAAGHSAGGANAARACQLDARIRACVSFDGSLPPAVAFPEFPDKKGFSQPVLLLEVDHTGDRMPFPLAQYNAFLKKKEAQLILCPPDSYDVVLKSAGLFHGSFSDYRLFAANGRPQETNEALHNLQLIESYTRAFLDKTLKQEKEPLLDAPLQSTEAKVKKYGL
jgi:dienelactone hydrolase